MQLVTNEDGELKLPADIYNYTCRLTNCELGQGQAV